MNMDERRPGKGRRRAPRPGPETGPAEVTEVRVTSLATGGDGVGADPGGRVTFVPRSAPQDLVEVRVVERKKRFARGEIVRVVEPSPARVEPPCALFARALCGGCQWQHMDVDAQRQAKAAIAARELRKAVAAGLEIAPVAAPVPAYGWRRRARLQYTRPRGDRAAILGFYAPRSHRVTDVPACPQLEPALADALAVLRAELAPHLGGRGEIVMLAGHTGQVHVAISGPCPPGAAARLVGKGGEHGRISGVMLVRARPAAAGSDEDAGAPGLSGVRRQHWGERSIELEPGLRGRADLFAQASRAGNEALLAAVDRASAPRAGLRVLELYAGSGNFTRVLARDAAEVVTTDSRSVPWRPLTHAGPAGEVMRALVAGGQAFDLVVLDPPRTGAAEVMEPLVALRPARVVYVSCDPATLARDLEVLCANGYRAHSAAVLDLMPQTAHVELVVTLSAGP